MKKSTKFALVILVVGIVCCIAAVGMGVGSALSDEISLRTFQYQEEAANLAMPAGVENTARLALDIDSAELVIQSGDGWRLSGGKGVTCEMSGDMLTLRQKNRSGWWYKSRPAAITLTIPNTASIAAIDIDVDAGAVTMHDITAAQYIKCDVDAGCITMENMLTAQLEADCDAGGIVFSGEVHGPVELNCDVGSIEVALQNGSTVGRVVGEVELGDITVLVNGAPCVKHDGLSQTISAALPGALGDDLLTIDCNVGSVFVNLTAKAADEAVAA